MPTDSVANYKSLAKNLWLYINTLLLWWSDFSAIFVTQNISEILNYIYQNIDQGGITSFAVDIQLCPGNFNELILNVN